MIPTYVPPVNADGNETSGVPSVLHQAPLGHVSRLESHGVGILCREAAADSAAATCRSRGPARSARRTNDPRPSVEERYGTLEGYVCVVEKAARTAVAERFLLPADADRLVNEAAHSRVLPPERDSSEANRQRGRTICASRIQ